jgi:parvulin-like peptidyl-prolyl isomerase
VPASDIAVVDGHDIAKAKFDRILDQSKKAYRQAGRSFPKQGSPEYQTLKTNIVNYLVESVQFELGAEDLGIHVTDKDVDKELASTKKTYFNGNEKKYRQALKKAGRTESDLRDMLKQRLLQERVSAELTKDLKVTDEDIKKYYARHKDEFRTRESRDVRHILLSCTTAKQCASARRKAAQLRRQLVNGASFAKLAKKYSKDPGSAQAGGFLTIQKGTTQPAFDKAAFSLKTHQLSQPIKTVYGIHVLEPLSAIRPATTQTLKQATVQIRTTLMSKKRTDALTKWVQDVKKKYGDKTEYQVGYAPPQSSTQTAAG